MGSTEKIHVYLNSDRLSCFIANKKEISEIGRDAVLRKIDCMIRNTKSAETRIQM